MNCYIFNTLHLFSQNPNTSDLLIWLPLDASEELIISTINLVKNRVKKVLIEDKFPFEFIHFDRVSISENKDVIRNKIGFYAQSDTLATSIVSIVKKLDKECFELYLPKHSNENADKIFQKEKLPFKTISLDNLKKDKIDVFVVLNDWTKEVRRRLAQCKILGIPTVCIQESIIDFGDNSKRMQHADYAIIQGIQTINHLTRKNYIVCGNPRYNSFKIKKNNDSNKVLINCNFTYNIFENERDSWIDDITKSLNELNQYFAISQHPRDNGDLSRFADKLIHSNVSNINEQLMNSKLLITRFSSLIHEALISGIPVIYYNPHGEKMLYDFEFNDSFLQLATNKESLRNSIVSLLKKNVEPTELEKYLERHCLPSGNPTNNIINILLNTKLKAKRLRKKDFIPLLFYHQKLINAKQKFFNQN